MGITVRQRLMFTCNKTFSILLVGHFAPCSKQRNGNDFIYIACEITSCTNA